MPSPIFASSARALTHVKCLLGLLATLLLGLEVVSNYFLEHASPTYARISGQYGQALAAAPARPGEPVNVLMVGNSLLLDGIEMDRLRSMTSDHMRVHPLFLEATGYYDWQYALQRLFRQGSRPDVVVLGVGVNYFLTNGVRQDYAPKLFFDARDDMAVASDLNLDRTATSNLLLAHFSSFWCTRTAIRTQMLGRMIPNLQSLLLLANPRPAVPDSQEFEAIALPRLQRLDQLCAAHGAKLILLVPPTLSSENALIQMTQAARKAEVEVSVPLDPDSLSSKHFQSDGIHLNSDGAMLFTYALAKDLPKRLANTHTATVASHTVSKSKSIPLHAFNKELARPSGDAAF